MKIEDLNLIVQMAEAMDLAVKALEKALEKNDTKKIKASKEEILKFSLGIKKLLV